MAFRRPDRAANSTMDDQQPTFKVVDRRPFNPDGSPRELSEEERRETERVAESLKIPAAETAKKPEAPPPTAPREEKSEPPPKQPSAPRPATPAHAAADPPDDPASFLSSIISLPSNAAADLGVPPHPVTGETGV